MGSIGAGKGGNVEMNISGGTFTEAAKNNTNEGLLAEGYKFVDNGDGTYGVTEATYVAQVGDVKYETLEEAIEAAAAGDTVVLLEDVTVTDIIVLDKAIEIDLGGKTVTGTAKKVFEVYADTVIKNGTINGANRCIDTRTAVELTVEDVTLVADKYTTAYGNPQPLTIGGSTDGTVVTLTNVEISAQSGYGIISFVETDLTATDSTISGYNALYIKEGSEDSEFTFNNCELTGNIGASDVDANSFSVIAAHCNDTDVTVNGGTITSIGNNMYAISVGGSTVDVITGVTVTSTATINGNIFSSEDFEGNTVSVLEEYAGLRIPFHGGGSADPCRRVRERPVCVAPLGAGLRAG